ITLEYNEKIRPRPDRENAFAGASGGESGIRTRDTVPRIHTFQACAFNHSATSPARMLRRSEEHHGVLRRRAHLVDMNQNAKMALQVLWPSPAFFLAASESPLGSANFAKASWSAGIRPTGDDQIFVRQL